MVCLRGGYTRGSASIEAAYLQPARASPELGSLRNTPDGALGFGVIPTLAWPDAGAEHGHDRGR